MLTIKAFSLNACNVGKRDKALIFLVGCELGMDSFHEMSRNDNLDFLHVHVPDPNAYKQSIKLDDYIYWYHK